MMEERARILNMVKDGKITVEEAETLLSALEASGKAQVKEPEPVVLKDSRGRKSKKLRVVVDSDEHNKKAKVNIGIPLSLARSLGPVILKSIPRDAKEKLEENNVDVEAILSEIENLSLDEDIVNIDTGDAGEGASKVRIYVE